LASDPEMRSEETTCASIVTHALCGCLEITAEVSASTVLLKRWSDNAAALGAFCLRQRTQRMFGKNHVLQVDA